MLKPCLGLNLIKEYEDGRGKIFFFSHNGIKVNLAEIKKGKARGGHYHPYDQEHYIISGKVEYREENIKTGKENVKIIEKPTIISVPAYTAHLFIALKNTLFAESFR